MHNISSLLFFLEFTTFFFAVLVSGGKTVRRPFFQRLHSVPVETKSKSEIPRSFSHPGALKDLWKFDKLKETFKRPGSKKHAKKGYSKFLFQVLIKYTVFLLATT